MESQLKIVIDNESVERYNAEYFADHPRARKARIKSPQHPSLNDYYKSNFQSANNLKQAWKDFIKWRLYELGLHGRMIKKCRITYTTYFKIDRRHDLDNISPKFILDGFVDAGLLEDDDYKHLECLTIKCGIDRDNPRMEFLIDIL